MSLAPLVTAGAMRAQDVPVLDERPAGAKEWGRRPVDGALAPVNPPAFTWRPHKGATGYEWQAARSESFTVGRRTESVTLPVLCPSASLAAGAWYWRYRVTTGSGTSEWSQVWKVDVPGDAVDFAMPDRTTLLGRLPTEHPRLFVRPEGIPALRARLGLPTAAPVKAADGTDLVALPSLQARYAALVARCDKLLKNLPDTTEPARYPESVQRGSDAWRAIWWGNRRRTVQALTAAADLAFVARLSGVAQYRDGAKKLLLAVAAWDPRGATSYGYNDEAGMPYAYLLARTYTFLHADLSAEERATCVRVMRVRGEEMYRILCPSHLGRPYGSHANRAWHFLGEVGIAFFGEIEAAADWVWFASRVFGAVYPVWSDVDGGWHEGLAYWNSYLDRFTWWADVQRAAYGVNAYAKPFFSHVGDFVLYSQPPGSVGGGFGDLAGKMDSSRLAPLMQRFAQQAQNPYWAWHAAQGARKEAPGFVEVLRGAVAPVAPQPPQSLPTSKLFAGTGVAVLNHTLMAAKDNVQLMFKSSPFGSQSHGYDAQNSFLLSVGGKPLLIRSGQRDMYGSEHHTKWMWSTRSTNSITAGGKGQRPHSAESVGAVTAFRAGDTFDYVVGEAGGAYPNLERFTRRILFAKPGYIVIHDTLRAAEAVPFTWWLHAPDLAVVTGRDARITRDGARCLVRWLWPRDLKVEQSQRFDPPPRPRIELTHAHITARTAAPAKMQEFVTVLRPQLSGDAVKLKSALTPLDGGGFRVELDDLVVELRDRRTTATWGTKRFDSQATAAATDGTPSAGQKAAAGAKK